MISAQMILHKFKVMIKTMLQSERRQVVLHNVYK
jgi:hypothetical protein